MEVINAVTPAPGLCRDRVAGVRKCLFFWIPASAGMTEEGGPMLKACLKQMDAREVSGEGKQKGRQLFLFRLAAYRLTEESAGAAPAPAGFGLLKVGRNGES
jgi:hypothetical protein